jgi:uncharacterized membrane protein (DUF441 family)
MMTGADVQSLILFVLAGLGLISNNHSVAIAVLILLLIHLTNLDRFFPFLEQYGLTVGIIILTIGVLAPLASGKISWEMIVHSFTSWQSLLAIAVGIFVSYLAGRGVPLMKENPVIVTGLLIGSILGVALFRGVPVGPLIAAGIVALFLGKG